MQDEDIWKRLIALARKWAVRFVWVQGQTGVYYNDLAGQVAREEAQQTAAREEAHQAIDREEAQQTAAREEAHQAIAREARQAAVTQAAAPENTQGEEHGLQYLAEDAVAEEMPGLFEYQDLGERGVMIKTPIGYPHHTAAPVYLLEKRGGYLLTDHGETLEELGSNNPELGDPDLEDRTIGDICARLQVEKHEGALTTRVQSQSELAYDTLRLTLAMFRVSALARDRTIRSETARQRHGA